MATFLLRIDDDQKARWAAAAKRDSRSLNSWIVLQVEAGIPLRDLAGTAEQRRAAIYGTPEQQREMAAAAPAAKREARGYSKAQSAGRKEKER